VSCRQFEEHLELITALSSSGLGDTPVVTFDDGRASDFEFALPLLEKHGLRAIFFVTVGLIENKQDFMTWEQIRNIESLGHSVQSHGWSHLLLTRAGKTDLIKEVEYSKMTLEDRIGRSVESISLPGGRCNRAVMEACSNAGYRHVYHSNPWKTIEKRAGLTLEGRLMVRNSMHASYLRDLLCGEYRTIIYDRTAYLLKETGKRLIGDKVYHRLWQGLARVAKQLDC
jgi:peptidoglycan/xylan/chitin deacetylase (PgdA/CDA1 family)